MASNPVALKQKPPMTVGMPDTFQAFRSEMDRLLDSFTSGFGFPSMRRMFDVMPSAPSGLSIGTAPAVDVSEDDAEYKITAELPGASEKDVEVNVSGDRLTIRGEKRQESERKDQNYYLAERSYGSFQRSFLLPEDVNREKVDATFSKGVLTVTLPRNASAKAARKIEIKGG